MLSGALLLPAAAASLDAAAVNNAKYSAKRAADDRIDAAVVKMQVLLDRARFSPGEIDGKLGENADKGPESFRRGQRPRFLTAQIQSDRAREHDGSTRVCVTNCHRTVPVRHVGDTSPTDGTDSAKIIQPSSRGVRIGQACIL